MSENIAWNFSWIPTSARMKREGQARGPAPTPFGNSPVPPMGRAEGQSPSALFTIPQDWGIKGVEDNCGKSADWSQEEARRWTQPTLQLLGAGGLAALFCLSHIVLMGFLYR
jgi:hypothetical protein